MPELLGMCDRIYVMNEGALRRRVRRRRSDAGKDHARDRRARETAPHERQDRQPPPASAAAKHAGFLKNNLREYGMLLSLFAIMLFFQVVTDGTLLRPLNLTNLVLQNSYIVIMALGMLLVIVTGHIDLSVGSIAGFIGAVAAVLMVQLDMHFVLGDPDLPGARRR